VADRCNDAVTFTQINISSRIQKSIISSPLLKQNYVNNLAKNVRLLIKEDERN
jgi:hypothetical protein